jgi:hypothetical protein
MSATADAHLCPLAQDNGCFDAMLDDCAVQANMQTGWSQPSETGFQLATIPRCFYGRMWVHARMATPVGALCALMLLPEKARLCGSTVSNEFLGENSFDSTQS